MENLQDNQELIDADLTKRIKIPRSPFTIGSGISVALALFAAQAIVGIIAGVIGFMVSGGEDMDGMMSIMMGITLIFAFPVAVWIVFRRRSLESTAWNWDSKQWLLIPVGFLLLFSISYVVGILMELLPFYDSMVEQYAGMFSDMNMPLLLIGGALIAPVCEEIIFRGIILKEFLNSMQPRNAILVSALIFSIIHMVPLQIIATFFAGVALGYIYYKTRSLWLVSIIHIVNNLIAFLMGTESMENGEKTRDWFSSDMMFYGSIILALVMVYVAYYLFERIHGPAVQPDKELKA